MQNATSEHLDINGNYLLDQRTQNIKNKKNAQNKNQKEIIPK